MNEPDAISDNAYDFDVIERRVPVPLSDIVNSSLDQLTVGLADLTTPKELNTFLLNGGFLGNGPQTFQPLPPGQQNSSRSGSLGRLTNLTDAQLKQIITSARTGAEDALKKFSTNEPYEFRLVPITGANPLALKRPYQFPLPPEKFDVSREQAPRTFVAIDGMEYSLPGAQTLASMTIEGMLPQWGSGPRPSFIPKYVTRRTYLQPKDLANVFDQIMRKGQPMQLTIGPDGTAGTMKTSGGLIGIMYVTIVSFQYGEAFGHPGDYVFSMGLKEWRPIAPNPRTKRRIATDLRNFAARTPTTPAPPTPPATVTNTVQAPAGSSGSGTGAGKDPALSVPPVGPAPEMTTNSPASRPDVRTYTVRSGDSLFDIAARYLGAGARWADIYKLNKRAIDDACRRNGASTYPRGWHLFAGTKLIMPSKGRRDAA